VRRPDENGSMKSEERHRLHENELAHFGRQAREWLDKHGVTLAIGAAAVLVVVGIVVFWLRSSHQTQANRWTPMITATDPERYGEIADEYPGTTVGQWARLKEAQRLLSEGTNLTMTDREASVTDLVKAREGFEAVLQAEPLTEPLRERALFGLARALEVLAGVEVGKDDEPVAGVKPAVEAYERLVQEFPSSVYVEIAQERIAALKTQEVQDFYAWYQKQNPSPLDPRGPNDQTGSPTGSDAMPGLSSGLPSSSTPDDSGLGAFHEFLREQGVDAETPPAQAEKPAEAEKPAAESAPSGPALPAPTN
jgi:hypothetical protein